MRSLPKRLWLAVAVFAVFAAISATSLAEAEVDQAPKKIRPDLPAVCKGRAITFKEFKPFSETVWSLESWDRGQPPKSTITAQRKKLKCAAGPGHLKKMQELWQKDKRHYKKHREKMIWITEVTPFYGGGEWWAIPYSMVLCESSGVNFTYGYYSMLDPAWHEWSGGLGGHAGEYSKHLQDKAASVGWDIYREGAWECKSDGEPHPY